MKYRIKITVTQRNHYTAIADAPNWEAAEQWAYCVSEADLDDEQEPDITRSVEVADDDDPEGSADVTLDANGEEVAR